MIKPKNWKLKFYNRILMQGHEDFLRKRVHNLEYRDGNFITAQVSGSYSASVTIKLNEDGSISSMKCSCPDSRNAYCRHEAAVLYEYEKIVMAESAQSRVFVPFREEFEGKEYFFNMYQICRNLGIDRDTYEKAESLIESGRFMLSDLKVGFTATNDSQIISAKGKDRSEREFVEVSLSRNKILSHNCYNDSCIRYGSRYSFFSWADTGRNYCEHEVALLILIARYVLKNNPGDYTNRAAMEFLDGFIDSYNPMFIDEEALQKITVTPRLTFDGVVLKADFKIGKGKSYVIKDIAELVDTVDEHGVYPLGTTGRINFSTEGFDEYSQHLFDFMQRCWKEEKARKAFGRYYSDYSESSAMEVKRDLVLFAGRIDDFYQINEGRKLELTDKSGYESDHREVLLTEGNPDVQLDVVQQFDGKKFNGVRVQGQLPAFIRGSRYDYFLDEDRLCRISPEVSKAIETLSRGAVGNRIDFFIGEKYLSNFYNHVMPSLKGIIQFNYDENALVEAYVPLKPEYDFYFDAASGMISCLPKVTYGENSYNLTDMSDAPANRDFLSEKAVAEVLSRVFYESDGNGNLIIAGDDDVITTLFDECIPALMRLGNVHATDAFDSMKYKKSPKVSVGVSVDNNLLELDIRTEDLSLEDLAGIIYSYRLKKKYHKLRDGTFIRSDDESIEELSTLLESLNISLKEFTKGKMHLPAYRALYLDKLLEKNNRIYDNRDFLFSKMIKDFKSIENADYDVPASLETIMRPYQKDGFRWLKTLSEFGFGGILADEMGLGKTLQMIAVLLDYKLRHESGTSLVVCPASLIYNWAAEFYRFAPALKIKPVSGTQSERNYIIDNYQDYDVLITSYDLLKRDVAQYENCHFIFEILDEAQYIKTHTTANAKSCKVIDAEKHFALTGTPIENNLSELWSIFDFLMPGFLYSYEVFRRDYETRITRDRDEAVSERLRQMIAPFILRRKKKDVLADLPDKIEEIIRVQFDSQQQKLYDSQVLKMTTKIRSSDNQQFNQQKIAILAELTKIRQICCEPALIYEDYYGASAKREACLELIKSAIEEGHKILLFSQFTRMLQVLEDKLKELNIDYYKLTGETPKEERLRMVNAFNNNDIPVFLISLKAGGTGLNLTGADIVIHYDPWWNLAAQNQATDRAHRIGQINTVTVYKIIAEGTIEEKIVDLQLKKSELAEMLLNSESVSIASLSKDELLDLLAG